ncbi:MAG: ribosome maturation factor RimP [Xanthomonadales bacterium]|nr:ribosome maturation factor RimP [Gammaproteobacteria bacterium]NNJ64195.1 ribosome maturation factor RimP [Xanthomonadales bacterium]NNK31655.1 ribosome maturation factor RimP [Xanthomonadales bacterium]NNK37572.1 ribosome maturation factor RimP [Xanthomonadales bacterium]
MASVKLTNLLKPLIEDLGYEFVGLEQRSDPKNPVLAIYIDRPEGISVEDCERVSREVAALLDVEDPIQGRYSLEISSPGLDRPLFNLQQFEQFRGETAQVTVYAPVEGRRKFKGAILETADRAVVLDQDGEQVTLEMSNIAKARLVPDYDNLFTKREETR